MYHRGTLPLVVVLILVLLLLAACGTPEPAATQVAASNAASPVPPTATPVPPTATPVPPTATPVPPTATPVPPTATAVPPTATAVPPTATSTETPTPELSGCEGVLGRCIEIVYEAESCTQVGPETLPAGKMTLVLTNRDDNDESGISLMLLDDGKTWSDIEEYYGPLSEGKPQPTWVRTVGRGDGLDPHESVKERLELTAGTYYSICSWGGGITTYKDIRPTGFRLLGGKLTVED